MLFNKNHFYINSGKKLLHKVGKHWVTVAVVALGLLGVGGADLSATNVQANANPTSGIGVTPNEVRQYLQTHNRMGYYTGNGPDTSPIDRAMFGSDNNVPTMHGGNSGYVANNGNNNINGAFNTTNNDGLASQSFNHPAIPAPTLPSVANDAPSAPSSASSSISASSSASSSAVDYGNNTLNMLKSKPDTYAKSSAKVNKPNKAKAYKVNKHVAHKADKRVSHKVNHKATKANKKVTRKNKNNNGKQLLLFNNAKKDNVLNVKNILKTTKHTVTVRMKNGDKITLNRRAVVTVSPHEVMKSLGSVKHVARHGKTTRIQFRNGDVVTAEDRSAKKIIRSLANSKIKRVVSLGKKTARLQLTNHDTINMKTTNFGLKPLN